MPLWKVSYLCTFCLSLSLVRAFFFAGDFLSWWVCLGSVTTTSITEDISLVSSITVSENKTFAVSNTSDSLSTTQSNKVSIHFTTPVIRLFTTWFAMSSSELHVCSYNALSTKHCTIFILILFWQSLSSSEVCNFSSTSIHNILWLSRNSC